MVVYKYCGALHLWWYLLYATNIMVLCTSDFDGKCLSTNITVLCTFGGICFLLQILWCSAPLVVITNIWLQILWCSAPLIDTENGCLQILRCAAPLVVFALCYKYYGALHL
jgi:hypothetical protein